jgi:hypothetical protein
MIVTDNGWRASRWEMGWILLTGPGGQCFSYRDGEWFEGLRWSLPADPRSREWGNVIQDRREVEELLDQAREAIDELIDRAGQRGIREPANPEAVTIRSQNDRLVYVSEYAVDVGAAIAEAVRAGARLDGALLRAVDLSGAELAGISLVKPNVSNCDFSRANLSGGNLRRADCNGTSFIGANLDSAMLAGASLLRADLTRARLTNADLCGTDLTHARIRNADFRGCLGYPP